MDRNADDGGRHNIRVPGQFADGLKVNAGL
jgi:hypothetical protein